MERRLKAQDIKVGMIFTDDVGNRYTISQIDRANCIFAQWWQTVLYDGEVVEACGEKYLEDFYAQDLKVGMQIATTKFVYTESDLSKIQRIERRIDVHFINQDGEETIHRYNPEETVTLRRVSDYDLKAQIALAQVKNVHDIGVLSYNNYNGRACE